MRLRKFKKFSLLASLLVLLGCMEGVEPTSTPTRSSANLSVPAQALDGSYLINHISCSGILDANDTNACRKSRFTITNGVGNGALYHYNFVTKRIEVLREWRSVNFSDVSQGRFNFQSSVREKQNWIMDGSTPSFTSREYSGTGDVQLANGRLEFIDWGEDRNYRFALIFSDGRTAWDQQVAATEARAQENRDRQQRFDNGVAILTGVAAGVSGQPLPSANTGPSTVPSSGAAGRVRFATECISVRRVQRSGGGLHPLDREFVNRCSYPVAVRYCISDVPQSAHLGCPRRERLADLIVRHERERANGTLDTRETVGGVTVPANSAVLTPRHFADPDGSNARFSLDGDVRVRPLEYVAHTCLRISGGDRCSSDVLLSQ